ncbi:hypothetical protein F2Q69_00058021 [Brassica cretica]|uniref:Leucine-rich repeat-containing N-terminal plant-type domain-containing protein n=1 Tax=Brassica cretica TaxID=69181 RepID=A0A8S9MSN6_BRACR|nr:hypothetical protein F2Q69_00058021 [Brassica cretica]
MTDQKKTILQLFFFFLLLLLESTLEQQTSSSSPVEKSALLVLRSSLGLRGRDWPVKGDPCLNWNGVRCDQNGSVTHINISRFRRTRVGNQNPQFSVDSLVSLTRLASFNASRFSLPGPIPVLLGSSLLTLRVLDLSSCSITGTIPANLSGLSRLTFLDLSNNSIQGNIPLSLTSLQNLSFLDLSSNSVDGLIPASIGALSKLQRLNLSHNALSSSIPPSLGDMSALVELDISFNDLSGSVPSELKELRNLQTLVVAGNRLSGSLPTDLFSFMSKLQIVDFRGCGFTAVLPSTLWSLPDLKILDLSGNQFSNELPNTTVSFGSTVSLLNMSENMFYGNLALILRRFRVVDLTRNYFQGKVPDFVPINASLSNNCLQGPTSQRGLSDCSSFYSSKGLSFDNFGQQPAQEKKPEDIQASSILLDDKFEVRLGSFSKACHQENNGRPKKIARLLSRLSQSSQESIPDSPATATCAYDVYCFGKILLELITGKIGISSCEEPQFKKILTEIMPHISSQDKEPVTNILDQSLLVDEDLLEEVWAMAIVARSCLNPKTTRRPLMRHVVQALENPLRVVREDSSESERFRTIGSSRGSSSSGRVFGSWRQSTSDPVAAGTSSLLSQAEGFARSGGMTGSSTRGSSRGASSRRSMKDV